MERQEGHQPPTAHPERCCACRKLIHGKPMYHDTITGEPMHIDCWMRDNEY